MATQVLKATFGAAAGAPQTRILKAGFAAAGTAAPVPTRLLQAGWAANGTPTNQAPSVTVAASPASPQPGETVTLTATASDPDGTIASYSWTQTAGPTVTLAGAGATRTFTAPYRRPIDGAATLTFQVVATDNGGAVSPAASVTLSTPVHPEWWFTAGWATYGPRKRSAL